MNWQNFKANWTRRSFLRDGARYGLIAGLAAVMAKVTTTRLTPESQRCVNEGFCRPCQRFTNCGLPQALSTRAVLKGGKS